MDFSGQVAIVTGAARGLGRAYALALAARGCAVLVNDLGGRPLGGGADAAPADGVVAEIRAGGGRALASYVSVTEGPRIVQAALDEWGRLDIVVCNAGTVAPNIFTRYTDEHWQRELDVHLTGTYSVARAAWPHLVRAKYGRVVMTSSIAGLFGLGAVAGYCAGKGGVIGLARCLAAEGANRNIRVNVVAPIAKTRLTGIGDPPKFLDVFDPRYVAALVAFLCHESCPASGCIYEAGGGWYTRTEMLRARGHFLEDAALRDPDLATPEMIRDCFPEIDDLKAEGSTMPVLKGGDVVPKLSKELRRRAGASKL